MNLPFLCKEGKINLYCLLFSFSFNGQSNSSSVQSVQTFPDGAGIKCSGTDSFSIEFRNDRFACSPKAISILISSIIGHKRINQRRIGHRIMA